MPATSIIPSLRGIFSTSSTTDCTTISSKCLSAPRRIVPSPAPRCLPEREKRGASALSVQVSVREQIESEIRQRGPIPFSRYMQICLYDPLHGYYCRSAGQFGNAGDFYTSSDVHAVFGRLLARQLEEMWRALGSPAQIEILELGPGRGLFAQDVLDWSEKKFPDFFRALHYRLVETSSALRKRLRAALERHFAAGKTSLCSAS